MMLTTKKLLSLLLLCTVMCAVQAQDSKQKLGFIPYSDPEIDPYGYRKMAYDYLYEAATRIFINTQRFEILDRSKFDVIKLEKNYQKGDDFINSELVAQGNALAAEVLAVAKLTALSVTEAPEEQGWSAFFTVELKQIDIESSMAIDAVQLKGQLDPKRGFVVGDTELPSVNASSPEQAIAKAVDQMERDLYEWIHESFPIRMDVLDFDNSNQVLYAKGGKDIGLTLKDEMCIRRVHRLETGDVVEETIAELDFTKTDGIGQSTTKFEPKKSKEWDKIVEVIGKYPNEIFVMESARIKFWDKLKK